MITALLVLSCVISEGSGSLNLMPGIIDSPRYQQTNITIQMTQTQLVDIRVDGPLDRNWSYREHGFALHADRSKKSLDTHCRPYAGSGSRNLDPRGDGQATLVPGFRRTRGECRSGLDLQRQL